MAAERKFAFAMACVCAAAALIPPYVNLLELSLILESTLFFAVGFVFRRGA